MLNANSPGVDGSGRPFANSQFGAGQSPGAGNAFSLGGNMQGMHSVQGGYSVPGSMTGIRPGMSGIPVSASQQQQQMQMPQGRFSVGMNPSGMQQQMGQYGQVPARVGLSSGHPGMNGMNGNIAGSTARGGAVAMVGSPGLGSRAGMDRVSSSPVPQQGVGMVGMGAGGVNGGAGGGLLGVRQGANPGQGPGVSVHGLNGPAAMGNRLSSMSVNQLGGQLGNLNIQNTQMRGGLGVPGMGTMGVGGTAPGAAYNPSGELLAMINKGSGFGSNNLSGMLHKGGMHDGGAASMSAQLSQGLVSGVDPDQPAFDSSDFPSLGGERAGGPDDGHMGLGDQYSLSSLHKAGSQHSEFSMQNEDFPALPSNATSNFGHSGNDEMQGMGGSFLQSGGSIHGAGPHVGTGYEQMLWNQQQHAQMQQQSGNPQLMKAGGKSGASGSLPDRFGLLGLLSVIRMTDQDLTTLALGTDLTTLGLNLNSPENLYKTFGSPWADAPVRPEPEYQVPACYLHTPPRLQPGYFSKFQQDTLFYIFYSMPGDEAQLFAADELASRNWWFHKELKMWLRHVPNTDATAKSDRFERSSFYVFDTSTWEVVRKDSFGLSYDMLERPPNLRRAAPHPGTMQPQPPALK